MEQVPFIEIKPEEVSTVHADEFDVLNEQFERDLNKLKDDKAEWYNYDEGGSNKLKAMGWQQESDRTLKQMQDQLKGRKKAVFYTSRCGFKDSKLIPSMAHS